MAVILASDFSYARQMQLNHTTELDPNTQIDRENLSHDPIILGPELPLSVTKDPSLSTGSKNTVKW